MTEPLNRRQTTASISWFWDLYQRELLNLSPSYQRRSVWNEQYRQFFLETVLLQYPAPALFLHEEITPSGANTYNVVDGQQRLTSVFAFARNDLALADDTALERYRGATFSQMTDDDKVRFWGYQFAVEFLPTRDEGVLKDIFDRINRNVARLTPQELRHARFAGKFASAAERAALVLSTELPEGVPNIAPQSRRQMKDVELAAQLLLVVEGGVRGFSQDELDEAYSGRDQDWPDEIRVEREFGETVERLRQLVRCLDGFGGSSRRLRNQADFYSLFASIYQLRVESMLPDVTVAADRLRAFCDVVNDEVQREEDDDAKRYYEAARSASNDKGQRDRRVLIVRKVVLG